MGRPLKKDVNGINVIGTTAGTSASIRVEFFDTELRTDGAIVKQRGAKSYVVAQMGNIYDPNINLSDAQIVCTVQKDEPSAKGQMRITAEGPGGPVYIAKITRRLMRDFDGNSYTWQMANYEDSTGDIITVIPV